MLYCQSSRLASTKIEREVEKDKDIIVIIIIKNKSQALMCRFSYIHVHQRNNNNSNKMGYCVRLWKETKASLLHSINSRLLARRHIYLKRREKVVGPLRAILYHVPWWLWRRAKVSVDEVLYTVQILYYYVYYSKLLMAQVHNKLYNV